jgi:hypothetical protein
VCVISLKGIRNLLFMNKRGFRCISQYVFIVCQQLQVSVILYPYLNIFNRHIVQCLCYYCIYRRFQVRRVVQDYFVEGCSLFVLDRVDIFYAGQFVY